MSTYHALIRTHHITSRKKVATLKTAAKALGVSCLLRSGSSPGIMYVEGGQDGVKEWVAIVQRLRYKDYHLLSRPANTSEALEMIHEQDEGTEQSKRRLKTKNGETSDIEASVGSLEEVELVKDFGDEMKARGVWEWWRKAMGFTK